MARFAVGHLAASIYGSVLTIALIAAYSAEEDLDLYLMTLAVVLVLGVFALAHAHAELMARRYAAGRPLGRAEIVEQLREASPMVEAGLLPALALLAGAVGLIGEDFAIDLALGIGVAELAAWGFGIGRRERLGLLHTAGLVGLNVALGLVVVALKLFIH
jgi:hypothetical protein